MSKSTTPEYIEVTQAFLRFYVVATQHLDHRLGTATAESLSQDEVSAHLKQSRDVLLRLVSINRIVPGKVEKEYEEIFRVGAASSTDAVSQTQETRAIRELRMVFRNKTSVLSDLLAVLRLVLRNT